MRTDILDHKDQILQWISEHQSKAFICRQLHCKPETLNSYLQQMNIVYEGNQGLKGMMKTDGKYKTAEEYVKKTCVKSHTLKLKLIRDGIKKYEYELCGNSTWMGEKIPLELHHKDGDHFNNDFDNLQILCPNCHALQNGNSGANIGKYAGVSELEQETDLESVG